MRYRGIEIVWLPRFCGDLGGPMGSIYRPNDHIVQKLSADQNRPRKFPWWDFWSKMTIFFDSPKMYPKCHILVFYRFRTLSGPQMADFRLYMTFATTSGQDLKNPKKWIFWWFWQFWQNWPIFVVAGGGRKWPGVLFMVGNMFSRVIRYFFIPKSMVYLI